MVELQTISDSGRPRSCAACLRRHDDRRLHRHPYGPCRLPRRLGN